jgi:hypothetical protein
MVEQMIITPLDSSAVENSAADWNLSIIDRDDDTVRKFTEETGRLDTLNGLPVGSDLRDIYTLTFTSVTNSPATIRVVMKVRETVS